MKAFNSGKLYKQESEIFRIIESNPTTTFIIPITKKATAKVKAISTKELIDSLNEGELEEIIDYYPNLHNYQELTANQKEIAQKYYQALNDYWQSEEFHTAFLIKENRQELIKELSNRLQLSTLSVRKLITKFLRGGMTLNAVIPSYRNRGGVHQTGQKTGRKRKDGLEGIAISQKERELFNKYYQKEYLKKKKSLKTTYSILLEKEYMREVIDSSGEKRKISLAEDEKPTFDQFYYWAKRREERSEAQRKHLGERKYNNDIRIDKASSLDRVSGPGSRFEMDATHLNVTVVSAFDRSQPIGRPLLYSVIDVFSRMVTGFCLTLKNESWESSAQTIVNTARNKVDFCKDYQIDILEEDWPASVLPHVFLIDNGAAKSKNIENLATTYGVEIEFSAPYSPRQKPNIEHKHSDYKRVIREFLPGADSLDKTKRGIKDPRGEAVLTLDELTKLIIEITLYFNHQELKDYPLTLEMRQDNIQATPVSLWQWGVANGLASNKQLDDINHLRFILLPRENRKITHKGIRFKNNYYIGDSEQAYRFLNNNQGNQVEIAYDPNNINTIYVTEGKNFYPLEIKNELSKNTIISSYDLQSIQIQESSQNDYSKEQLIQKIQKINQKAQSFNTTTSAQKKKNLKQLRQKRKEEILRTQNNYDLAEPFKPTKEKSAYDLEREEFLARKKAERNKEDV